MKHTPKYFIIIALIVFINCNDSPNDKFQAKQQIQENDSNQKLEIDTISEIANNQIDKFSFTNFALFNVGQLEQFFSRFHGRDSTLFGLLNKEYLRHEYQLVSLVDTSLLKDQKIIEDFINDVLIYDSAKSSSLEDHLFFGNITYKAIYKSEEKELSVSLKYMKTNDNSYMWNIIGAKIYPSIIPRTVNRKVSLRPNSHNLKYLHLLDYLADTSTTFDCTYFDFKQDNLSVLLTLIYLGEIKLVKTTNIEFISLAVPGWLFKIKDIARIGNNSGWMINSIIRIPDKDKKQYCINQLGIDNEMFLPK